eukprot:TRINITY_DN26119_c0_g1_i1.p1 TRINITY_DN26119_c0_g1~~TRINITY_DN26119_c0_g1_i1.p1  ORF type:complete len:206 (-),score=20.96 TRINITY_DN26119_c0_g1_i1:523-1140(-)
MESSTSSLSQQKIYILYTSKSAVSAYSSTGQPTPTIQTSIEAMELESNMAPKPKSSQEQRYKDMGRRVRPPRNLPTSNHNFQSKDNPQPSESSRTSADLPPSDSTPNPDQQAQLQILKKDTKPPEPPVISAKPSYQTGNTIEKTKANPSPNDSKTGSGNTEDLEKLNPPTVSSTSTNATKTPQSISSSELEVERAKANMERQFWI